MCCDVAANFVPNSFSNYSLERVDRALKANCTRQDELKFCHGGKPPAPISNKCVSLLEEDCKKFVGAYDGNACCKPIS